MDRQTIEHFRSALAGIGISTSPKVEEGMEIFLPLLEKWSRRVRLVGSTEERELALKHFADSLTLLPFLSDLQAGRRVLDVGSGAGFPGIPLALARPDLSITMVESDGRKASYILAAIAALELENAKGVHARAEVGRVDEAIPQCDFVVSRALTDPERWLPLAREYTTDGGTVAAMMSAKAPPDELLERLGTPNGLALLKVWRGELAGVGTRVIAAWRAMA